VRRAVIDRKTTETQITLGIALEGRGSYDVRTGIRFFDHMLELFARHGAFDLHLTTSITRSRTSASRSATPSRRRSATAVASTAPGTS
jgi:imidazoleglycerol phosphate dehydratase HisB